MKLQVQPLTNYYRYQIIHLFCSVDKTGTGLDTLELNQCWLTRLYHSAGLNGDQQQGRSKRYERKPGHKGSDLISGK